MPEALPVTESPNTGGRWLQAIAIATACTVFPLIFVGAGVTSQDAGMAYPDWPTSGGHLINPPQWWQQNDTRWEHGHRLIGWVVGMLAIATATMGWRRGGAIRIASLLTLGAIVVQGVLGGLRVTEISRGLATMHGVWGQTCFCLAVVSALLTFRRRTISQETPTTGRLVRVAIGACACVFLQLVLGATLRHFGGTHALIAHICWAIVVMLAVGFLAIWVSSAYAKDRLLSRLGRTLAVLLFVQLGLGWYAFMVTVMMPGGAATNAWFIPTAHVAVGALLFATCITLAVALAQMLPSRQNALESAISIPAVSTP